MTFNPRNFVKTATETWRLKEEYDQFIKDNAHLAAPFFVDGLEDILPKTYPGNLTVHFAKSHHGKSTALRNVSHKAQRSIEDTDYLVGVISLEDSAETIAAKQVMRYGGNSIKFQEEQMVFIGNSFNMSADDMNKLNVTNIIKCLEYALDILPGKKGYSRILLDYSQIVPPDPERMNAINADQRRQQIADDTRRLFHAAKQFKCPIDFAAQALLKQQRDGYTSAMAIPGAADLKEAGELYEIPDVALAYWQPKHEKNSPIGTRIEDGNWSFVVEPNLMFLRIAKWRNAELQGFVGNRDIVGRVFPCRIKDDGKIFYDPEYHNHIYLKPMPVEAQ
jgi:replicative DNA helicase